MKFFVLSVVCLVGVASAYPGVRLLAKRDILPGDPRYGTEHHHHHHEKSVQTPHTAYGVPNHIPGAPIHRPDSSDNRPVTQPIQQYLPAFGSATKSVGSVSNQYLSPVVEAAQTPAVVRQPANNQYLAPVASVQKPDNRYLGPVTKATENNHHHVQQPIDSYGTPVTVPHTHYGHPVVPQVQPVVQQVPQQSANLGLLYQSQPETYTSNYYSNGFESLGSSDSLNVQSLARLNEPQSFHVQAQPAVQYNFHQASVPQVHHHVETVQSLPVPQVHHHVETVQVPQVHHHVETLPSFPVPQVSYHEVSHAAPVETSFVDEHREAVQVESVDHSASHHESSQLYSSEGGYVY